MVIFLVLFILSLKGYLAYRWYGNYKLKTKYAVDYSFGFDPAKKALKNLIKGKYQEVSSTLPGLSSNEVHLVVEYLSLMQNEKELLAWLEKAEEKNLPNVVLGLYYIDEAWRARSSKLFSELTEKQKSEFGYYLEKVHDHLSKVEDNSYLSGHAFTYLITYYMAFGEVEDATECYSIARQKNPDLLETYVRYANAITPKWGGSLELIQDFLGKLPKIPLIRQVMELRYINASYDDNQNYFGGTIEQLKHRASAALIRIDGELAINPPETTDKYTVYNYMFVVAGKLNDNALMKKYNKLINGYYTITPHGIMR